MIRKSLRANRAVTSIAFRLLLLTLGGTASAETPAVPISVVQLLAQPDRFDGKLIRTIGYASFSFEETALFLTELDAKHKVYTNGLWLDTSKLSSELLHEGYVLVEGTFDAKDRGHLGSWAGSITLHSLSPWK